MEEYDLGYAGKNYIAEIRNKCYWQVVVSLYRVEIIERGSAWEGAVLILEGKNFKSSCAIYDLPNDYYDVMVANDKIIIINEKLSYTITITITGENINVYDWWGWGAG